MIILPGRLASLLPPGTAHLAPGRVLTARVSGLQGNTVTLSIMGRLLTAKSFIKLNPGDLIKVEVARVTGGEVWLKVLPDAGQTGGRGIDGLLRDLGLRQGEAARAAVRGLMAAGIPVTRENVENLINTTQRLGPDPLTAEAVALLRARGLPARPELVDALRRFLAVPPRLGELLPPLDDAIPRSLIVRGGETEPPGAGTGALPGGATLSEDAPSAGATLAGRLREAVRALGLDYEGRLAEALSAGRAGIDMTGSESVLARSAGMEPPLKAVLLALGRSLDQSDQSERGAEPTQAGQAGGPAKSLPPRETVRNLLDTITSWQVLSQAPQEPSSQARHAILFQLPLLFGKEFTTMQVEIEKPRSSSAEEQEAGKGEAGGTGDWCSVRIGIAPPALGELRIDLFWQGARLAVAFAASRPDTVGILSSRGEDLADRLAEQGFHIIGIDFRVMEEKGPSPLPGPGNGVIRGIDLTA